MNVLLIDDSKTIQSIVSYTLEKHHYSVTCQSTAESAIQYLNTKTPDIILTDLNMPGIGGAKLIEKIRQTKRLLETPIVIISTSNKSAQLSQLVNGWINKPLRPEKILEVVSSLTSDQTK